MYQLASKLMRRRSFGRVALLVLCVAWIAIFLTSPLLGQDEVAEKAGESSGFGSTEIMLWGFTLLASIAALAQAHFFYRSMKASDEGTPRMIEIAGYVRDGASAYLMQQYKVVAVFFVVVFILLVLAVMNGVQATFVPIAFLTGGFWSGLAGFIGMKTATQASNRTAAGAQKSLNAGLQVAFRSGAVMGLTVVGLGLLDMSFWYAILKWVVGLPLEEVTVTMLCSLMGASSQALFARVGGGIFTKAADVGADLVGKVEQGIPEDDPRNPATIADNVGDNVGDVAGMGADLYESYCGSILATAALGVAAFGNAEMLATFVPEESTRTMGEWQLLALFLPFIVAACGLFLSIGGIYLVKAGDNATQKALLGVLGRGIDAAAIGVVVVAFAATYLLLGSGFIGLGGSIVVGLAAGWIIGKWTEYVTSDEFKPTQNLAAQSETGPATVIIGGLADGMKSVWVPVIVVCAGMLLAFSFANRGNFEDVSAFTLGLYGVGIAAVGMLSTLGITLATDAYGPIADNAGGNAEMSELEPIVRERTDALDSLGNTTAATGKGFAIGSAALTALALLAAYVEQVRTGFDRWAHQPEVVEAAAEGAFYKASRGFVIYSIKEGEETKTKGFLVMPEFRRDKRVADEWAGVKSADGPAKIPADMFSIETGTDGLPSDVRFAASGDALVGVRSASLPDFARYYNASLLNPKVLVGVFLGCMATFVFCAMTMKAVGRAAKGMVEEVRRQFREKPGIMEGTDLPDYKSPVAISTKAAQKEMILPSLLGLTTPLITGMILGVGGVIGLLVGTLTCGFCVAIFMANSGGAWDNAKKYIEAGNLGGKGSDAHKAGVVGDTVGDPFKDTSGPSLNILIKLMSMVSVVSAGLVVRYSLMALGIF